MSKLKVHFKLKRYCSKFILTSALICLQSSLFFLTCEKSYEDLYHSPPHVLFITENILIMVRKSMYWFLYNNGLRHERVNFNYIRDLTNSHKLISILIAEYASFSHQARMYKTNLLGLCIKFF